MGDKTGIEWCDLTWNIIRGCTHESPGCLNCYAEDAAARVDRQHRAATGCEPYRGLIKLVGPSKRPRWTGEVRFVPDLLDWPLRMRRGRRIFVNSMSDLFHPAVADKVIDQIMAVMLLAPQHTFMILTKRSARMRQYLNDAGLYERVLAAAKPLRQRRPHLAQIAIDNPKSWPARWIWWGVSIENQDYAVRAQHLVETPAAVRYVSAEPLIGPLDLSPWLFSPTRCKACGGSDAYYDTNPRGLPALKKPDGTDHTCLMGAPQTGEPGAIRCAGCQSLDVDELRPVDLVIAGCESGKNARRTEVEWLRKLRDDCRGAHAKFFLKQANATTSTYWLDRPDGSRIPAIGAGDGSKRKKGGVIGLPYLDGVQHAQLPRVA